MHNVEVDRFRFSFPAGWIFLKWDDCPFYRNQFNAFASSKALDLLALAPARTELWMVEIKDYQRHRRSKVESLFTEMARKVRDTLAGLAAARVLANDPLTQAFAYDAMRAGRLRVAFLVQQPKHQSKVFPQIIDQATGLVQLRKALRAVDPHAFFGNAGELAAKTDWVVTPP